MRTYQRWARAAGDRILGGVLDNERLSAALLRAPLADRALATGMRTLERAGHALVASVNVVNTCNLHCAGCYWSRTERLQERDEMDLATGLALVRRLQSEGVRQFMFLGGEPLRAWERVAAWVREVARLGAYSTIITNGTYGLPAPGEWPSCHYFLSCDGDAPGMLRVRGRDPEHGDRTVYELLREAAQGRQDVMLNMTISRLNVTRLRPLVAEARAWGVGGVVFAFATPAVGETSSFYLDDAAVDAAVDELLALKREYGDFICLSRRAIALLRHSATAQWSPHCPTFLARALRADGVAVERCIFGPSGDCSRCGCNIITSTVALREGDRETARLVLRPIQLARAWTRQVSS